MEFGGRSVQSGKPTGPNKKGIIVVEYINIFMINI
jgi:hypothetical protein